MAKTETATVAVSGSSALTKTKSRSGRAHPSVASMVTTAIDTLDERNGTSLQAIKKFIFTNYKVDLVRLNP